MTEVEAPALLHVDLDAFFASVEQLLDPTLRGRPVIVGGTGTRGVVAAASYEARRFGVHSAMPTGRARRLCPVGVFLSPRIDVYRRYSDQVFEVFRTFTPRVEPISMDEAFLDVAGSRRLFGAGPEVARRIKARVREETGLVCSVGVGTTKLVAKLASDASKPDGLLVVEVGGEEAFLAPLPVERLWGVGPATRRRLDRIGVRTVGDLVSIPLATLVAACGEAAGNHLYALAHNEDERTVTTEREAKSLSAEETFPTDIADTGRLAVEARRLAHRVADRLRAGRWAGRTVTVKVRFGDFRTITRSATFERPTDAAADVTALALDLLGRVDPAEGVRLLGVGVSGLEHDAPRQEQLPFDGGPDRRAVDAVLDAVRERFGADALGPASLVGGEGLRTGRATEHSWGPDDDGV